MTLLEAEIEMNKCKATDVMVLKLNKDVNVVEKQEFEIGVDQGSLTIDLNGHTFNKPNMDIYEYFITVGNNGTLTITDSSVTKSGKITGTYASNTVYWPSILVYGGTLKLEGGYVESIGWELGEITIDDLSVITGANKGLYSNSLNKWLTIKDAKRFKNDSMGHNRKYIENVQVLDYIAPAVNTTYKTHVQKDGWQNIVTNGAVSGTEGQSKRLEGININVVNKQVSGGIRYKTHVQGIGWQDWVSDGAMSGTKGESRRLEAIKIELTGDMANNYDLYYRVHAQSYGWLGWAKNGEDAGTAGLSKRLEAIQIVLVPKGGAAPGTTDTPFRQ